MNLLPDIPDALVTFRDIFSLKGPKMPAESTPSQSWPLDSSSGYRLLGYAPARDVECGFPPRSQKDDGYHRYLWVINEAGIPFIKEIPIAALGDCKPKHTNLTGGYPAFIGGELWFKTSERLFVSGGSGRYKPNNEEHLADAVSVFEAYRYEVTSLGWNYETGNAKRTLE